MKKFRNIILVILCLLLTIVFFVGCEQEEKIESNFSIYPFSTFYGIGELNSIEISNNTILWEYTYTFSKEKDKEDTEETAMKKINDEIDRNNKNKLEDKEYKKGIRVFTLKDSKIIKEEKDTKINFTIKSDYLDKVSTAYIERIPLKDYLKRYDINKDNYLDKKGNKVDLARIKNIEDYYYMEIDIAGSYEKYKGNLEIVLDGNIVTMKENSFNKDSINKDTFVLSKNNTEFIYAKTNNTLLCIMIPIASVIVIALVLVLIKRFVVKKDK